MPKEMLSDRTCNVGLLYIFVLHIVFHREMSLKYNMLWLSSVENWW